MKIKSDFVTNSSSTCYIVLVPDSFVISDEKIKKYIDKYEKYYDEDEIPVFETIKTELEKHLNILKNGGSVWNHCDGTQPFIYYLISETLANEGLKLSSVDMGPDSDMIVGINEENVMKIFMNNVDLSKFIKVKRSNDVKQNS